MFNLIVSKEFIFKENFRHCEKSNELIDIQRNCENLDADGRIECESFLNDLKMLSKFKDQFNYINSP